MKIYTRTGDDGTTALYGGKRVLKCEELVDVYGSLDELNSWLGLIASDFQNPDVEQFLHLIQSDIFTIGSYLAGWKGEIKFLAERVGDMESRIDIMDGKLPRLRNFILPGGGKSGSRLHIARSIARRVERQAVGLMKSSPESVPGIAGKKSADYKLIIKYLNRLSDLLFVLARFINKVENKPEIIWSK